MPVKDEEAMWAEKPCLFRFPCVSAAACTHCRGAFTFWNGRRHCEFCGYIFHRVHCTRKCKLEGEFFRRRICVHCDFYRNIAGESLREGGDFTCYRKGKPTAVRISLSEERGELDFVWLSHGVPESLGLQCIQAQKGFSHEGHMRTADYDPLKSLSLLVKTGRQVATVDLRAPSAWICQLWVDGLNAAKYIHQRTVEQTSAMEFYSSMGERVYDLDSWFGTNYLPLADSDRRSPRGRTSRGGGKYATLDSSYPRHRSKGRSRRCVSESPSEADNDDFVEIELPSDTNSPSSHLASPSPLPVTSPVHVPTSSSKADQPSIHSTPGLPYLQTSLPSLCGCHAFKIGPPRSFDPATLRDGAVTASRDETTRKCCTRCRLACRIAVDLSNL